MSENKFFFTNIITILLCSSGGFMTEKSVCLPLNFIHTLVCVVGFPHWILMSYSFSASCLFLTNITNPVRWNLLMFCFGCHTQNSKSADKPQICHEGISAMLLWIRERFTQATRDVWPAVHSGQSHPFHKQKLQIKWFWFMLLFSLNVPLISH